MGVQGRTRPPRWWQYLLLAAGFMAFAYLISSGMVAAYIMLAEMEQKKAGGK